MADENKKPEDLSDEIKSQYIELADAILRASKEMNQNQKEKIAGMFRDINKTADAEHSYLAIFAAIRYAINGIKNELPERYNELCKEFSDTFSISLEEIEVDDEQPELDLEFPPTEESRRIKAPPYIFHDKTIMPLSYLVRTIDRLKFDDLKPEEIEEIGIKDAKAIAQIPIDKSPHSRYIYMLMLDRLAAEYPITPLDKNILIAIGNLYGERKEAGYTGLQDGSVITAEHIIRRYRGLDAYTTIEPSLIEEVEQRMKVLMDMMVSFDFTQHFDYRKLNGDEVELDIPDDLREMKKEGTIIRFSYRGNMVHANQIEVEYSNGKIGKAFEILTPPIVYDYARKIKQVATIETKLLDLRKKANGSKNADIMKVYLLERILAMIDPKTHQPKPNFSHSIKLDRMFEDLRMDVKNRVSKKNKVDTMKKILDHFKETEDSHRGTFIKGYTEQKGYRGAVIGFEIHF